MSLLSRKTKIFSKFKTSFTLMEMVGALLYLVYPAGVKEADGYSYRIVQTVLYHGLMIAHGVFAICFNDLDLRRKTLKYDLIAITSLAVIAVIANNIYSGVIEVNCTCQEGCLEVIKVYNFDFNWFFVKHDPLYIISDEIDISIWASELVKSLCSNRAMKEYILESGGLKEHSLGYLRFTYVHSILLLTYLHCSWGGGSWTLSTHPPIIEIVKIIQIKMKISNLKGFISIFFLQR